MGHDVMFIGNLALPLYFMVVVALILTSGVFGTFLWVNKAEGVDPSVRLIVNLACASTVGVVGLYWAIRGLVWVIRVTLRINGGRVEIDE